MSHRVVEKLAHSHGPESNPNSNLDFEIQSNLPLRFHNWKCESSRSVSYCQFQKSWNLVITTWYSTGFCYTEVSDCGAASINIWSLPKTQLGLGLRVGHSGHLLMRCFRYARNGLLGWIKKDTFWSTMLLRACWNHGTKPLRKSIATASFHTSDLTYQVLVVF